MGSITIKDDIFRRVAALAEARGLTADEQAEAWIRESLERHSVNSEMKKRFRAIAAMTPEHAPQSDSLEWLHEARNR